MNHYQDFENLVSAIEEGNQTEDFSVSYGVFRDIHQFQSDLKAKGFKLKFWVGGGKINNMKWTLSDPPNANDN